MVTSYDVNVNHNDTIKITISSYARFATDPDNGTPYISVYLNVNGTDFWLLGNGDSQSRTIKVKYEDVISIYSRYTDPNYPYASGNMEFSTINFNIKQTVESQYYTKTEINENNYVTDLSCYQLSSTAFDGKYDTLTGKPTLFDGNYNTLTNKPTINEYSDTKVNTLLNTKGYLTSIPSEYVTETE